MLKDEEQNRTTIMKIDVTHPEEIKEMIDHIIKVYKKIDVLVVNAGVVRVGPVETFPDADYDLLINVNLKGTHYTDEGMARRLPLYRKQNLSEDSG